MSNTNHALRFLATLLGCAAPQPGTRGTWQIGSDFYGATVVEVKRRAKTLIVRLDGNREVKVTWRDRLGCYYLQGQTFGRFLPGASRTDLAREF